LCNIVAFTKRRAIFAILLQKEKLEMENYFKIGILSLILLSGCKKDDVDPVEDNELITTVKLTFNDGVTNQIFQYSDSDGDGGKSPIIDKIILKKNTAYSLTISILDESKSPAFDIGKEVAEESDEHLFVYTPTPATLLTYTYQDKDSKGYGIGLKGNIITNGVGTGMLKVQLRHQPPVNGVASKNGTPTPGSDDVNIDFEIKVE
jgi:hypothetical protein